MASDETTPDPVDIAVGSQLRETRIRKGMTQSTLASALNVTFQQVQKYETGANRISASKLFQAAKVLETSVQHFFQDAGTGVSERDGPAAIPHTPASLEIGEIARRLPPGRRRLVLALMRTLDEPSEQTDITSS